ncbi:MAG: hypothetical protein M3304_06845, partial [Actinomycetota bacterium]|nr:hypothetical protein [Actinomycetota bacterium]
MNGRADEDLDLHARRAAVEREERRLAEAERALEAREVRMRALRAKVLSLEEGERLRNEYARLRRAHADLVEERKRDHDGTLRELHELQQRLAESVG